MEVESINQITKYDKVIMVNAIDLPYPVGKETKLSVPDNSLWT